MSDQDVIADKKKDQAWGSNRNCRAGQRKKLENRGQGQEQERWERRALVMQQLKLESVTFLVKANRYRDCLTLESRMRDMFQQRPAIATFLTSRVGIGRDC
jgi:hypothetical protein